MQSVCAWCGTNLGAESVDLGRPLSHGICHKCMVRFLAEDGVPLTLFVAALDVPVLLVDGNLEVQAASPSAPDMTGKTAAEVEGKLGGDVFECANASLPGGCGRTVHCSGCVLRRTVTDTYSTGQAHRRVPATLKITSSTGPEDVAMYVTTEKVADRVLLRIERHE